MARLTQVTLKAPELVLDTRDRQEDLGITYSQSQTPSRGHPVHHQETSRRPLSPQDPPASRSSHCASVEPGRIQTRTGLGTQILAHTGPRDSRRIHGQSGPYVLLQRAGCWQMAISHPTHGHSRRALPYLSVATRDHRLLTLQPQP